MFSNTVMNPASFSITVFVALAFFYCVGSFDSVSQATPSSFTAANWIASTFEAFETPTFRLGDWIVRRGRAIAVTGYQELSEIRSSNYSQAAISGRIIVVTMKAQNRSTVIGDLAFSTFELIDEQGRKYREITDPEYSLWRNRQGYESRISAYYPGEIREEVAAFVVPPDASRFSLLWRGGLVPLN
ncbi:MAG TPA: hypothetical protein V6D29_12575 [Leptolyngbyaceae cyanobacterium]